MRLVIEIPKDVKETLDRIESLSIKQLGDLQVAVMHGTPLYDSCNIWHTIKGFNRNYSHDANVENGVDLPDVGRDVLVIYPRFKGVYAKRSTEEGMTGTDYYDGTMWAYYDKPVTNIDGGDAE